MNFQSYLRVFNGLKRAANKVKVPEKVKGGRVEKIGNYFYNIYGDYKAAFLDTLQDIKDKPLKASFYFSLLGTGAVFYKLNPTEASFKELIIENANDLALVGEPIRSKTSDKFMENVIHKFNDGYLRYQNVGLFSIIYKTEYNKGLKLFNAQCKYAKPHWTEFHKSILDVGVLGRWIYIDKAMENYDINEDEWR
ncbi:hypothetical protein LOTGIDRAFT_106249 [Lottia gigantea]|uniref:Uncharacterized protein n=1 Tax=Lottia gigantea TaxID=225164 RepID=V4A2E0_LOTGI|nr:hypothetical protein LOTGIDRAFT_106249 [Lottia gigantea]ESO89105.1 hypothetical protein LOTGIDRAFT_106249 [Lottia gigantea]